MSTRRLCAGQERHPKIYLPSGTRCSHEELEARLGVHGVWVGTSEGGHDCVEISSMAAGFSAYAAAMAASTWRAKESVAVRGVRRGGQF